MERSHQRPLVQEAALEYLKNLVRQHARACVTTETILPDGMLHRRTTFLPTVSLIEKGDLEPHALARRIPVSDRSYCKLKHFSSH